MVQKIQNLRKQKSQAQIKKDKPSGSESAVKSAGSKNDKTVRTGDKTQFMTYVIALVISSLLVVLIRCKNMKTNCI